MNTVASLGQQALAQQLHVPAISSSIAVRSIPDPVATGFDRQRLRLMYADYPLAPADSFADFSLKMGAGRRLASLVASPGALQHRRLYPFEPLPWGTLTRSWNGR